MQAVSALERGVRHSPRADTLALLIRTLELEGAALAEFESAARAAARTKVRHDTAREPAASAAFRQAVSETSFVGRERELIEIVRALERRRCVTLWGPGGVGKTRLATESFAPLAPTFGNRIAFAALAPTTEGDSVVRAVSAAYDLVDADVKSLLAHLGGRSSAGRTLLVLDNCEHVIESVSRFTTAALARLPDLSILATSREPLRIDGEQIVRVGTLAVGTDAVRLFLDRAEAASGGPANHADLDCVARIARRLDGLPLAIELAAARARTMSVRAIELALDERFSLLTRGNRSLDRRHQTLRDTIGWSYDLLEPSRRIVFERLALLNGSFAMEHAVAIAADAALDRWNVVDAVADLVDKALVGFAPEPAGDDRGHPYAMLESTRLYATALRDDERADRDVDGAWRRFGAWLIDRACESYDSFVHQSEIAREAVSIDHLRGYLRWAIDDDGDVRTAATIVGTLMHWWSAEGLTKEGLRWTESALTKLPLGGANLRARATLLFGRTGLLRTGSFHFEASASAFEAHAAALELAASDDPDPRMLARTAFMASEFAASLGRRDEAEALIQTAIDIYERLGDAHGSAVALTQAAEVARLAGDIARCRTCYRASIDYFDRHGNRRLAAHARANLAETDYLLGDVRAAVEGARAAAEIALELSSSYYVANTLSNLAAYLPDLGAIDEAADVAQRGLDVARDGGFEHLLARLYQSCATVAAHRGGDAAEAAALFAYTIPRVGDVGFTERRVHDRLEALLRERLSGEALATAMRRGADLDAAAAARIARDALAPSTFSFEPPVVG